MHEIGVLLQIVKTVEEHAKTYEIKKIKVLVLQVGEMSSMIPKYLEKLYPIAIQGSILEDSILEIQILPANGMCRLCHKVFSIVKEKGMCPTCQVRDWEMLCGNEFTIKEIRY